MVKLPATVILFLCLWGASAQGASCSDLLARAEKKFSIIEIPKNQAELLEDAHFQNQLDSDPRSGAKQYWFQYNSDGQSFYFSADPIRLFPWGSRLYVIKLEKPQKGLPYAGGTQELVIHKIASAGNRVVAEFEMTDISLLKELLARLDSQLNRSSRSRVLKHSDTVAKDMDLQQFFQPGAVRDRMLAVIKSWTAKTPEELAIKNTTLQELEDDSK